MPNRWRLSFVLSIVIPWMDGCAAPASAPSSKPPPTRERGSEVERRPATAASQPFATRPPGDVVGLPGEYDPVDKVLFAWSEDSWSYFPVYLSLLREILPHSGVVLIVPGPEEHFSVAYELALEGLNMRTIEFVYAPLDSMWIRDYGPLVVRTVGRQRRVIDAPYSRLQDDKIPTALARRLGWSISELPIELDGGHLQADGRGTCVVSLDVLVLAAGKDHDEAFVRQVLSTYLGCRHSIFVPPLDGEETGHVDLYVYVTGPKRALVGEYRRWQDRDNQLLLDDVAAMLKQEGFSVTRVPMPSNSRRSIFRTYTNAVAVNGAVFVPTYEADRRFERTAIRAFREAFPDRSVIPVFVDDVIELGGALHCIAMTVPAP